MNDILLRLNDIEKSLKAFESSKDYAHCLLKNRLRARREGILFALRSLGIELVRHYSNGWLVHMEVGSDED